MSSFSLSFSSLSCMRRPPVQFVVAVRPGSQGKVRLLVRSFAVASCYAVLRRCVMLCSAALCYAMCSRLDRGVCWLGSAPVSGKTPIPGAKEMGCSSSAFVGQLLLCGAVFLQFLAVIPQFLHCCCVQNEYGTQSPVLRPCGLSSSSNAWKSIHSVSDGDDVERFEAIQMAVAHRRPTEEESKPDDADGRVFAYDSEPASEPPKLARSVSPSVDAMPAEVQLVADTNPKPGPEPEREPEPKRPPRSHEAVSSKGVVPVLAWSLPRDFGA
jgi:hypothetical protein